MKRSECRKIIASDRIYIEILLSFGTILVNDDLKMSFPINFRI